MNAQQYVFRVRRNYNRWVANETLEDYALRFTAKSARKWSIGRVAITALGAISFLALEAIGGAITLNYGFDNAIAAILVVSAIVFLTGIPITYYAAVLGIDIDLLTRGAGFGYIGSTITSLIYASFTFIFFALEAAILSLALQLTLGVPLWLGYILSAIIVIPLVTHGITFISQFQLWTQPLWLVLQLLPLICIAYQFPEAINLWTEYSAPEGSNQLNLVAFGAASAVLFSLIAQIGEQVDFLRFLPEKKTSPKRWWLAMLAAGPGWIIAGAIKLCIGSFLAVLAINHGIALEKASDPNHMYLVAYGYLSTSPQLTLFLVAIFVILSQIKINVTNAYAGSIAWSNFFSRLTHNHPGRVVWLVFNVAIALMLMELGIYRALEQILGLYSIIAIAWLGSIVADLVINKPLGLRPQKMEFKRAALYDINPVGVGSMLLSMMLGFMAYFSLLGETLQPLSSFVTLIGTLIFAPLIALLTRGRYYLARDAILNNDQGIHQCCICSHEFETEDTAYCPAYSGFICSLCCSLDSRCQDLCKTNSRISQQITSALSKLLPQRTLQALNTRLGHFLGLFFLTSLIIAALLALVYFQITLDGTVESWALASALTKVFFILLIICGVVAWMFALAYESRAVAQQESKNQNELLIEEIEAHKETDYQLQQAKELAEAANMAKSRYLTGISHELRSPLNAIMGYAQLLERDTSIPEKRRDALSVISRSSEHLADLIEGLLDISRIEAGRLELTKSDVHLRNLLDQIVSMFRLQAQNKNIQFEYRALTPIPEIVRTDEKRLRQILINLLSNAVKYTHEGSVLFTVSYRNQVAEFNIKDTGEGIAQQDLEKIFNPFERIRKPGKPQVSGTGLGLTITRLLLEIMGGDLQVNSAPNQGSLFKVSLMLTSVHTHNSPIVAEKNICGYLGNVRNLFIVDDESSQRSMLNDLLAPLNFTIVQAQDAETCLNLLDHYEGQPDIFLLDVSMPGKSGVELAEILRQRFSEATIIMVSANAHLPKQENGDHPYDAYLVKPFSHLDLFDCLQNHAAIDWLYEEPQKASLDNNVANLSSNHRSSTTDNSVHIADPTIRHELIRLANIGYIKGLQDYLEALKTSQRIPQETANTLIQLAKNFQISKLIEMVET